MLMCNVAHHGFACLARFSAYGRKSSRHRVISSFDITPVAVPEQVLVHLVGPRRVVVSVGFLRRKRASHSSLPLVFLSTWFSFQAKSAAEVLNPRALIPCKKQRAEAGIGNRVEKERDRFNGALRLTQYTQERQSERETQKKLY